ncbi:MAG: hypothetical protein AAF804_21085 [Bacteroidota bacterium]
MNLDKAFVLEYLFDSLGPWFHDHGYQALPQKQQFRQQTEAGFTNCIFSVAAYDDAVWIEFHLGIRLEAVEGIVHRFTRGVPKFASDAHTVIFSEGKWKRQPYLRHEVKEVDALDQLIKHGQTFLAQEGLPFLEEHCTLSGVDALLNGPESEAKRFHPNPAHRFIKGLVVRRLLQDPDFSELADAYERKLLLTPTGSLLQDGFRRLRSYLEKMSLN